MSVFRAKNRVSCIPGPPLPNTLLGVDTGSTNTVSAQMRELQLSAIVLWEEKYREGDK